MNYKHWVKNIIGVVLQSLKMLIVKMVIIDLDETNDKRLVKQIMRTR